MRTFLFMPVIQCERRFFNPFIKYIERKQLIKYQFLMSSCITVSYSLWVDLVLEMEEAMRSGEYNIHLMYYEDLK